MTDNTHNDDGRPSVSFQGPARPVPERNEDRPPVAFLFPFVAVTFLHIVGVLFPSYNTWGFNHWSVVESPISFLIPALALLLLVPPIFRMVSNKLSRYASSLFGVPAGANRIILPVAGSLLLLLVFYFLRSRALVYGDGYMVLDHYANPEHVASWHEFQLKPLACLLHRSARMLMSTLTSWTPEHVFGLTNAIGGLIGWWAIYRTAGLLAGDRPVRWLIVLATMTSGSLILFFGYIEYYTWATSMALWSLCFSVARVQGRCHPFWPIIFGLLAVGFHILTVPFLMTAILAVLYRRDAARLPFGVSFAKINWAVTVVACLTGLLVQVMRLPKWLVVVWPIPDIPYWFLSADHIIDVLNELILVAPLAAFVFLWWLFSKDRKQTDTGVTGQILASTALYTFLVSFWVEPGLGGVRDWDLSSFFGFPLSLWGIYWLVKRLGENEIKRSWIVAAMLVLIVHIAPNVYEKADARRGAAHLDGMLYECPHYQPDYLGAQRGISWGVILSDAVGEPELAEKYFRRRLEVKPTSASAWYNLGEVFRKKEMCDSAVEYYGQAHMYNPQNALYLFGLANCEDKIGRLHEAFDHIRTAVMFDPRRFAYQMKAGIIASKTGRLDVALHCFRRAHELNPHSSQPIGNMGLIFDHLNRYDSAYVYLVLAKSRAPNNVTVYGPLIRAALALGKYTEARETLTALEQLQPDAADLEKYRQLLRTRGPR